MKTVKVPTAACTPTATTGCFAARYLCRRRKRQTQCPAGLPDADRGQANHAQQAVSAVLAEAEAAMKARLAQTTIADLLASLNP